MDREKVKGIIHKMETLLHVLKKEFEDSPDYVYEEIIPYIEEDDVDEYYSEEDDV